MGAFSADIGRFIRSVEEKADLVMRKTAIDLTEKVRSKTPVDSGQLRASWTSAINAIPIGYDGNNDSVTRVKFGDTWFLATNKPYAPQLEYGLYPNPPKSQSGKTVNGFSKQAPQGMVRISVQETIEWLKKVKF
ncbi:HK97 gp10 family phage protein [Rodentibacter haemolyticus]|uniref:HK97 gp10 family phage protein n=1 Tax=Rodentibacter haemolyticus TaxID=2778911 RepID=A0ABX6UXN6_9PAST|nr:HK97 gp10 family phage protein [Rodentibacter haemolyticus]QPB42224.1 HK97 gp10 family phage protein [Rodentibacter haemolyticus]